MNAKRNPPSSARPRWAGQTPRHGLGGVVHYTDPVGGGFAALPSRVMLCRLLSSTPPTGACFRVARDYQ